MNGNPHEPSGPKTKPASRRKPASCSAASPGSLGKDRSREANCRAAAILEVLGGLRVPAEAAAALGISVTHYYILERKALAGLLAACEPLPKGPRGATTERKLATLERELETCRRECLRQAALVRATQRTVGLPAVPPSARKDGKAVGKKKSRKGRRRPAVRALRAVETLRQNSPGENRLPGVEKRPSREGTEETMSRTNEQERHGDTPG